MDDKTKYGIKIYNKVRGRKVILTLFFLEVYLKFLYNASINNKIKDLSEIKEHENNEDYINLFVYEEGTKYNYYKIGDLVFVHHYKYNNGNKGINHIFLIVDIYQNKNFICYFGMLISSKTEKLKYKFNKYIKKDNKNNLKTDSIVKTDVIYKIFTKNILLKIGNIDKTKVDIYKNYLINNN